MSRVLIALLAVLAVGCGSSPRSLTAPSAPSALNVERSAGPVMDGGSGQAAWTAPLNLALSGQSNAGRIKPFLEARASVVAYAAYGGMPIAPCWDVDGQCWAELKPQLLPTLDAFVWWQGDADDADSPYRARMADLVRRVRVEAKNPKLLILVLQLGPVNSEDPDSPSGQARAWAQADPDAVYVDTRDIGYDYDRQHMTAEGYRAVTERIVATVTAKRR